MPTAKTDLELQPHFFVGVQTDVANGLAYLDEQSILFPSGNKCVRLNTEEKSQDFIPVTQKGLGLRALALSADRRYLAVSERGKPGGIIIYDLKNNKAKHILRVEDAAVEEFVSVAFSHDFQYLIGQSGAPGWILYFWNLREKRLVAQEKTGRLSHPINQVSFSPEDSTQFCVSGRGVLKLFQLTEEKLLPRSIKKLRNMESLNFLAHLWVSKSRVIVGTDSGRLLGFESGVLDWESGLDSESSEEREWREHEAVLLPSVMSIAACSNGFVCSAGLGRVCLFEMTDDGAFKKSGEIRIPTDPHDHDPCLAGKQEVVAMCVSPSGATLLASTDRGQLYSAKLISSEPREKGDPAKFEYLLHSFHWDTITSLSTCIHKPLIATASKDLSVCIWNFETRELEIRKGFSEEPRSVALNPSGLSVMVVFRARLWWMNLVMDTLSLFKEFKLMGCTECAFSNGGHMFAAVCGTTVHIYSTASCDPVMKLEDHKAAVRSARWSEDDGWLVTRDSDGVVYLWNMQSGELDSECSHKTARYTGAIISPDAASVFTIGNDCTLREIRDGQIIREVRPDVTVTAVALSREGKVLFCGTSAGTVTVRSCPLSDSKGLFECRGHTGAITRMEVTYDDQFLLTISKDGSLLIWKIVWNEYGLQRDKKISYLEEVLISKSDLRQKNFDMIKLNSRMEKLKMEQRLEAQRRDTAHETAVSQMREEFTRRMEALEQRNHLLVVEKQNLELEHRKILNEEREEHERVILDLNSTHARTLGQEYELCHLANMNLKKELEDCKQLLQSTMDSHKRDMEQVESRLQEEQLQRQASNEQSEKVKRENELMIKMTEEDAEAEIQDTRCTYEKKLKDEQERSNRYENEAMVGSQMVSRYMEENHEKSLEITRLTEEVQKHQACISSLQEENLALRKEDAERNKQMKEKENQMSAMRDDVNSAEELRLFLENIIEDLKQQIKNREQTIGELKEKVGGMEKELFEVGEQRYQMKLHISGLKRKLTACHEDRKQALMKASDFSTILSRLKADLLSCVGFAQDPKKLKASVLELHRRYIQPSDESFTGEDQFRLIDGREKEGVLWTMVKSLKQRLAQEQQRHSSKLRNTMQENATLNASFMEEFNEGMKEAKAWEDKARDFEQQLKVLKGMKSSSSSAAKGWELAGPILLIWISVQTCMSEDNQTHPTEMSFNGDYSPWTEEFDYGSVELQCQKENNRYFRSWFMPAIYSVICAVGLVGNLLVMLTYVYFRQLKTMTDVYLLNLAAADLLFVLTLPFWVVNCLGKWELGLFLCKAMYSIYKISFFSGMLLLTCISVDRYFAIARAVKAHSCRSRTVYFSKLSSLALWALALLFSVPEMTYTHVSENQTCTPFTGSSSKLRVGIQVGQMVAGFSLPALVMGFCYCAIIRTLMQARNFEKNKAIKVIFAVVAVFLLCQVPYNLTMLVATLNVANGGSKNCAFEKGLQYAVDVTQSIAFMRCCVNPFLYAFIGVKFRHNLLKLLKDLGCVSQSCLSTYKPYLKGPQTTDMETTTSFSP